MNGVKTGGRKAGTPNKLTHEYRVLLAKVLEGEIESLPETLSKLQPHQRVDTLIKLIKYVVGPVESVKPIDVDKVLLDPDTHEEVINSAVETDKLFLM